LFLKADIDIDLHQYRSFYLKKILNGYPKMVDFAIWGEALSRSLGYKENEFLDAYYNNIKFQNTEVIDSNPVAFAIIKLVEQRHKSSDTLIIFEGTSIDLLEKLNEIAIIYKR
jgi:hypothetical protein